MVFSLNRAGSLNQLCIKFSSLRDLLKIFKTVFKGENFAFK